MERFGKQSSVPSHQLMLLKYRSVVKGNAQPSEIDMLEVRRYQLCSGGNYNRLSNYIYLWEHTVKILFIANIFLKAGD